MSQMRCPELREVAPDMALGLLTGKERARALAHLERCESCRIEVASLAGAADELLLAAPEANPPAGFDIRVLARLADERASGGAHRGGPVPPSGPRRFRQRAVAAGLAVAAAAAAALLVAGLVVTFAGGDDLAVATGDMVTGRGRVVGDVTASGDPAVVTVSVPAWGDMVERWGEEAGTYSIVVEAEDGSRTRKPILSDDGAWTVPVDAGADDLVTVSVLDDEGRVWCSGRLST
ncbi:MAG TPA: hypothetical protein VFZ68_12995 [Acidimicrobiales bacterium]